MSGGLPSLGWDPGVLLAWAVDGGASGLQTPALSACLPLQARVPTAPIWGLSPAGEQKSAASQKPRSRGILHSLFCCVCRDDGEALPAHSGAPLLVEENGAIPKVCGRRRGTCSSQGGGCLREGAPAQTLAPHLQTLEDKHSQFPSNPSCLCSSTSQHLALPPGYCESPWEAFLWNGRARRACSRTSWLVPKMGGGCCVPHGPHSP